MKYATPKRYQGGGPTGSDIGSLVGTGAAMAIPGAQPFQPLLAGAGSMIGSLFDKKEEEPEPPASVGRVFKANYGFRGGGGIPPGSMWLLPGTKPTRFHRIMAGLDRSTGATGHPPVIRRSSHSPAREPIRTGDRPARQPIRTGDRPARKPMRTGDRKARPARRSGAYQTGGALKMGGRSHEAGGVNLASMGRPDVEVERGEVVQIGPDGQPEYVFSALRMDDKPRTFAEEYERLSAKEDFEGINKLKMKQEAQMGRKKDVTMDPTLRKAHMSKNGGSLKGYRGGGSLSGYSPKKAAMRYGGTMRKRSYQTGGVTNPWDPPSRTFYSGPSGTSTSLPARPSPYKFIGGPKGVGVSGLPVPSNSGVPARTSPRMPGGLQTLTTSSPMRKFVDRWAAPLTIGVPAGIALGEAVAGDTIGDSWNRWGRNEELLDEATQNRRAAEAKRDRIFERFGNAPGRPEVPNPEPQHEIIEETIDPSLPEPERVNIGRASLPGVSPQLGTLDEQDLTPMFNSPASPEAYASEPVQTESAVPEAAGGGRGQKLLRTVGDLAPYAADIFNVVTAARMKEPERGRALSPVLADERVSTTADEEAVTRSARAILGDPTASASQKLAAVSRLQQAKGQIRSKANERSDAIGRENVNRINRAREFNQVAGERHADRQAQFRGAKASAISSGVRSIGDRLAQRSYESRLKEMEPVQLASAFASMPTEARRNYINSLLDSLPKGHRLRPQLEALRGGN